MELINFNDNLYQVYRKVKESHLKPGVIELLKEDWHCDTALKRDDMIYMCRMVVDAVLDPEDSTIDLK